MTFVGAFWIHHRVLFDGLDDSTATGVQEGLNFATANDAMIPRRVLLEALVLGCS